MIPFWKFSLRKKLTSIILLACSLVILLISSLFIGIEIFSFRREMLYNVNTLAEVIVLNSTRPLWMRDEAVARDILSALSAEPDVITAIIYDERGRVFAAYHNLNYFRQSSEKIDSEAPVLFEHPPPSLPSEAEVIALHFEHLDIVKPIRRSGELLGNVFIRMSMEIMYARLAWFLTATLCGVFVSLFLAYLISFRLQKLISKPMTELATVMKTVSGQQKYDIRATRTSHDELGILVDVFNHMLDQIQERDRKLKQHREELEEQVKARTAELMRSNEQLKQEIADRERMEQERNEMQKRLAHAQKMEAIGTLAAGVAHDLNNILSGIVSYPELLLLDINRDSPLYKPLITIQKSGERATAIVSDLLTLARRNISAFEPVDLREISDEYLKSPEFEKLMHHHPFINVETAYDPHLYRIIGSPIHLAKALMNLITNAMEAMPEGGTIHVSLENRYIDLPIGTYDHVAEGEYVVLTVSDSGTGIATEDINRIFEPFYTKKKMGRSGTGLGMAVVWGTVKDHKGYIDVESFEGVGTTFSLYFPATREDFKAPVIPDDAPPMTNGRGEHILIVDDVREQREIASLIIQKLGYRATAVGSGEEAVAYLKENHADLLVLDMIMDPGIDGLETFRQITEIRPDQRAIIVSGFAETERVREAQRLGAGNYIKKPYRLETLMAAIRSELDRK